MMIIITTSTEQQIKAEACNLGPDDFTKIHFLLNILWFMDFLKVLIK